MIQGVTHHGRPAGDDKVTVSAAAEVGSAWGRARGPDGRVHAAPAAVNARFGNEQPLRCDVVSEADAWRRLFCLQIYNEKKSQFEIKRNNPKDLVERVARDISKLLNNKRKALEVRRAAEHA